MSAFQVKHFLIVDDDQTFRKTLAKYLCVFAKISEAGSLAEARTLLAKEQFHVVLLDKNLTDGSGLELVPEIQKKQLRAAIIVISGDMNLAPIYNAIDTGIDDYVVKTENILQDLMVRIPLAACRHANYLKSRKTDEAANVSLPRSLKEVTPSAYHRFLQSAEKQYLERVLALTDDDISLASRQLGVARSTVHKKVVDFGVNRRQPTSDHA